MFSFVYFVLHSCHKCVCQRSGGVATLSGVSRGVIAAGGEKEEKGGEEKKTREGRKETSVKVVLPGEATGC